MHNRSWFTRFAGKAAHLTGRPAAFGLATGLLIPWLIAGPFLEFSRNWEVTGNIGLAIVPFLMVFLIQNAQNRDTAAMQIKLDELIRVTRGHNALMDLEELDEDELEKFRAKYEKMAAKARKEMEDTGSSEA